MDQAAVVEGALDVSVRSESVVMLPSSSTLVANHRARTAVPLRVLLQPCFIIVDCAVQVVVELDDICVDTPNAARLYVVCLRLLRGAWYAALCFSCNCFVAATASSQLDWAPLD